MKYISIDIETTGLDRDLCQVLSIGAVIEDTNNIKPLEELPTFHAVIKRESVYGSIFALNLNRDLIKTMVNYSTAQDQDEKNDIVNMTGMQFYNEDEVVEAFFQFCYRNGVVEFDDKLVGKHVKIVNGITYPILSSNMDKVHFTAAGKNFASFDQQFLVKLPRWKQVFAIRSRVLDPGILFVDWKNDESVPSLDVCKQRAGIDGAVTHNAVEDAIDVVKLLRKQYQIWE